MGTGAAVPLLRTITTPEFTAADGLFLTGSSVELWSIDLAAVGEGEVRWRSLLSQDEVERASRFHFDRDRRNYLAARGLLRILLGGYQGIPPQNVRFRYLEKGKPVLDCASDISFNLSHSGDVALVGITRNRPIGVDVEKVRRDFDTDAIARRFFSTQEQQELSTFGDEERYRAFFTCWTLKESFIKALGEGLSHPLHQFDVTFETGAPVNLTTRPNPQDSQQWELQTVNLGPGYAAAFAVQRQRND